MTNGNAEPTREAAVILRMAFAFVASQVVYQAADLGLADHLSSGALSARELAGKIGARPDAWERVLQVLVALGILKQTGDAKFELTALAGPLRSDVPNSAHSCALSPDRGLGAPLNNSATVWKRGSPRSITSGECRISNIGNAILTYRESTTTL